MQISEKIRKVREQNELTQAEFAAGVGVSQRSISNWETGERKPPLNVLKLLCKKYEVDPVWLITEGKQAESPNRAKNDDRVRVFRYSDAKAAAGRGVTNFDEQQLPAVITFDQKYLRERYDVHAVERLDIIDVEGTSMMPTLEPGEAVLVEPMDRDGNVKDGKVYVVEYYGEIFIKRIQRNPKDKSVRLISDNKDFMPIVIEGDDLENLHVIGRALLKNRLRLID
jgi:phage repressor protein C with HTH and peptisase S24 domain